jgi:menaquinone-dependent protoporphyrinogen oxidase
MAGAARAPIVSAMTILVAAASKHGATLEIAEALARGLTRRGLQADVRPAGAVDRLDGYDAVVLGSAVYAGHWLKPARELAERIEPDEGRPVWLFSSGPVGAPDPKPDGDPIDVEAILRETGAREHRVFAGRLDRDRLGLAERAIVRALRAPIGDFRDWDAIEAFANGIADALDPTP